MADLSQLFKYAPGTASFMTGAQQATDEQTDRLKQQELVQLISDLQQKSQQESQMQPLKMQEAQLRNQTLEAQLPGILEELKASRLANAATEATQPTTIAATNSNNKGTVRANQAKAAQGLANIFNTMGPRLEVVPPAARAATAISYLKESGVTEDHPLFETYSKQITNSDPEQLPDMLKKIASGLIEQSATYKTQIDVATTKADAHAAEVEARIKSAEKIAELRRKTALAAAGMKKQGKDPEELLAKMTSATARHAALTDQATKALQAGDRVAAAAFTTRANAQIEQMEIELSKSFIKGTDIEAVTEGAIPRIRPVKIAPKTVPAPAITAPGTPAPATAKPVQKLPPGTKQIGTSGGKPVYLTPSGERFIGN